MYHFTRKQSQTKKWAQLRITSGHAKYKITLEKSASSFFKAKVLIEMFWNDQKRKNSMNFSRNFCLTWKFYIINRVGWGFNFAFDVILSKAKISWGFTIVKFFWDYLFFATKINKITIVMQIQNVYLMFKIHMQKSYGSDLE